MSDVICTTRTAAALTLLLSYYCTTLLATLPPSLSPAPDCSCWILQLAGCHRTRAPVRRCRRPPHLCRTCSALLPPGSCRHQLIRLHHQLLRTSGLGLASCMQLQAQLLQHLRRLCLLVETRCYLSPCLPYGRTGEGGEGRARLGQVTIATCTITSSCRCWELGKDTRN